jgi:hypothetical protein
MRAARFRWEANASLALTEILEAARTIREAVGRKERDDNQGEQA